LTSAVHGMEQANGRVPFVCDACMHACIHQQPPGDLETMGALDTANTRCIARYPDQHQSMNPCQPYSSPMVSQAVAYPRKKPSSCVEWLAQCDSHPRLRSQRSVLQSSS
jgi:hypothetical protein